MTDGPSKLRSVQWPQVKGETMKVCTAVLGAASSLALTFQAGAALAQSAAPAPAPSPTSASQPTQELGEVIVTAQKRSENINAVGMSITAATGQQLKQKGITTVSDLVRIEPSLQFSQSSYGTPIYTIRGVGYYEQSLAASPTVSIYQDEVSFPFPVMSRGVLLDPERVEILKGPQGTLYGQNATGGAINFITAKPTNTFDAGVDDSWGRFNDNLLSGFISGPLTATLSARLSGSIEEGGAWQKSETRNDTLGNKNTQIGRLILTWRPTSNFTASLNLNGWEDHSDTVAPQLEGVRFISPGAISPDALVPVTANYLPNPAYYATYPAAIKSLVNQPTNATNDQQADWAPGTHPKNDESFYQAALRMDYAITDSMGVTSLTSYEHFTESNLIEPGGVGAVYTDDLVTGDVSAFSQELRLHGTLNDAKGHWLVGVNYEEDKSDEADITSPFLASPAYLTGGSAFSSIPLQSFTFTPISNVDSKTASIFANADYSVLDAVTLHAGVRYTQSDQRMAACAEASAPLAAYIDAASAALAAAFGGATPTPVSGGQCITVGPAPNFQPGLQHNTLDQSNVPWRVGIDWTPFEHQLFYVTISKGYKAGASPSLGATDYVQVKPVTQESILAYEVGAKSSLFDRTLQLDASLFHYDYADKQELGTIYDPIFGGLQTLVNIPKSAEDGAEVSAVWRPIGGLTLNAAVTYLDSRVTSNFFNYSSYILSPTDTINFKGEPFPYTPRWSVQYGARYDWRLTDGLSAFASADASYQSVSYAAFGWERAAPEGAPAQIIKPYGLLNLTAGVATADNHWRFELWGKNVTNTYYWNTVVTGGDMQARITGMPTTYGLALHYRY
jgi:outer membrane receptor protein involved in Fe transport